MSGGGAGAPWPARRPIVVGLVCLLVLVGGLGGWAATARIGGAVIAPGRVEVAERRQVVQHPDGGIVADIAVKEGDVVAAGDLLIRLDAQELASELAVVEGQLLEVLARRARLEAEEAGADELSFDPLLQDSENPVAAELMAGSQRLFAARRETVQRELDQLARRRAQVADQIAGIDAQATATERQLALLGRELDSQRSLRDRGLAQSARLLELESEQAALDGRLGELAAARAEAEGRVTETSIEALRLESARREEASAALRDLSYTEIELAERRRALRLRLDRLEIRAPVGGVVLGLTVFAPRSVIRAADPVLYLVPQDSPLVMATRVAPLDVDQVHVGQEVTLRFAAFDQRRTPELEGHVVGVSADAFDDEASGLSFYRVDVALAPGQVARLPPGAALLPGMPVDAFIQTTQRTPLEYIVQPLSDYFARAFRET